VKPDSLRICLMTPELPPYRVGGIGTYVAALAEEFGRLGHTVDVVGCDIHPGEAVVVHSWGRSLSLRSNDQLLGGSGWQAMENAVRWMFRHRVPGMWRVYPYTAVRNIAAAALSLRRFVQRRGHHYDVIEYSNWPGQAAWLPKRKRAVYVARLSTSSADTGGSPVALAMERQAVRRADTIAAHSQAMARKGEKLYGLPDGCVRPISLGLPDGPLGTPPEGPLRLVTVGRAEDRKGTDLLISALAAVLPEYPEVMFRFVGPGLSEYLTEKPALRAAWERLIATCPGRVEDSGRLPDAERERAVGQAHWMITPSRFESFGLVAVEAMRAGTPVVYAAAGGLEEVGTACPVNIAVRPDDGSDLERAIRTVCREGTNTALAARTAARRAFDESFSAKVMADRTLDFYRAALEVRA